MARPSRLSVASTILRSRPEVGVDAVLPARTGAEEDDSVVGDQEPRKERVGSGKVLNPWKVPLPPGMGVAVSATTRTAVPS